MHRCSKPRRPAHKAAGPVQGVVWHLFTASNACLTPVMWRSPQACCHSAPCPMPNVITIAFSPRLFDSIDAMARFRPPAMPIFETCLNIIIHDYSFCHIYVAPSPYHIIFIFSQYLRKNTHAWAPAASREDKMAVGHAYSELLPPKSLIDRGLRQCLPLHS